TLEPVDLPEGDYRVRLSQPGVLSETWLLRLDRGHHPAFPMALEQPQRLLDPVPGLYAFHLGDLGGGHAEVNELSYSGLRRVDGGTGGVVWSRDPIALPGKDRPGGLANAWNAFLVGSGKWIDGRPQKAALIQPPPKLEPGGAGDLVLVSRSSPS